MASVFLFSFAWLIDHSIENTLIFRSRMVDSAVLARGPSQPIKRRSIEKPRPLRSDPDLICLTEILKLTDEVEFGLRNNEARNDVRTRIKVFRN